LPTSAIHFSKILWPAIFSVDAAGGRVLLSAVTDRGYSSSKNALELTIKNPPLIRSGQPLLQ
jgi:hypothetical protein